MLPKTSTDRSFKFCLLSFTNSLDLDLVQHVSDLEPNLTPNNNLEKLNLKKKNSRQQKNTLHAKSIKKSNILCLILPTMSSLTCFFFEKVDFCKKCSPVWHF